MCSQGCARQEMSGGNSRGQKVPFLKSPAHVIIHGSFSALWQQGGAGSGDITTMGDAVLIFVTNPPSGGGSRELGCSPARVSVSDRKNKLFENTDSVDVTKPHVVPRKKFGGRFLISTKYTFNQDSLVIPPKMKDGGVSYSPPPMHHLWLIP